MLARRRRRARRRIAGDTRRAARRHDRRRTIASPRCSTATAGCSAPPAAFADLAAASDEIDTLIEAATVERIVKRLILVEGRERPAGVARVEAGEGPVYLLIVGPEEAARRLPAAAAPRPCAEPSSTACRAPPPADAARSAHCTGAMSAFPADGGHHRPRRKCGALPLADGRRPALHLCLARACRDGRRGQCRPRRPRPGARSPRPSASTRRRASAQALAGRGGWSGITVAWPVQGAAERIGVDPFRLPGPDARQSLRRVPRAGLDRPRRPPRRRRWPEAPPVAVDTPPPAAPPCCA